MSGTVSRFNWVDVAKGVAITLVVFGHCWRGLETAGIFANLPSGVFAAVDQRIYAFHMPLFFMISGFFLVQMIESSKPLDFVASRVLRLLYPLVLWTYIFAISKIAAGQLSNTPLSMDAFPRSPIPGIWQFWFLWALFLLHIGLLLFRPAIISTSKIQKPTLWLLFFASLAVLAVPLPPMLIYWTNGALNFAAYLLAGALLGVYGRLTHLPKSPVLIAVVVCTVLIAMAPQLHLMGVPYSVLAFGICLSGLALIARFGTTQTWVVRPLRVLGRYSMIVFLSHTLFSAAARIMLLQLSVTNSALHVIIGTAAGLIFPVILFKKIENTPARAYTGA